MALTPGNEIPIQGPLLELEQVSAVTFYLRPTVPCIVWMNTGITNADQFKACVVLFKALLMKYAAHYPNLGALMHVELSGSRTQEELRWAVREMESLYFSTGLRKLAFILPTTNEPLGNLSYFLTAVQSGPIQVHLFGTQVAAENWLQQPRETQTAAAPTAAALQKKGKNQDMLLLYTSPWVDAYWQPSVPCLIWRNTRPTPTDVYFTLLQAFWGHISMYLAKHPTAGVIMDVRKAGKRSAADMRATAEFSEKKSKTVGLRKLAIVFSDADEPITGLAALLEHAEDSVVQVRLFGTPTLAERWLKEMK